MSEVKTYYRINSATSQEINLVLSQLADRLDQIEGFRGTPTFHDDVTFEGNVVVTESEIMIVDSNGTIIHSFGGIG